MKLHWRSNKVLDLTSIQNNNNNNKLNLKNIIFAIFCICPFIMHLLARKDAKLMEPPMREILFLGLFGVSV
jgi:hypothetical protein